MSSQEPEPKVLTTESPREAAAGCWRHGTMSERGQRGREAAKRGLGEGAAAPTGLSVQRRRHSGPGSLSPVGAPCRCGPC